MIGWVGSGLFFLNYLLGLMMSTAVGNFGLLQSTATKDERFFCLFETNWVLKKGK